MNRQEVVLLVLFHFYAAFDTLEHSVLLSRLSASFGIQWAKISLLQAIS